ncbi:magnesium-translocating P-type ATPase [Sphingobium lignivorans]|uniref:Magnesium-transporting ATPase, P-type 1 n=1 Tax=Sphingobium lignivorans TaxID=2735886 RepID=A0ABR6NH71_9SPHN|nr:magnesium-translocating P-type ATPase [Sphingobium lignivorans]MBB5986436.1 Mg2+-importing ATPase [Sphingobium lignivorans]
MIEGFWSMSGEQALTALHSTPAGLESGEAAARLEADGPNAIEEARSFPALRLLARQFKSPLVLILVFGAMVSMVLREWLDATIILLIVSGSCLLSFLQEYRASKAVAALRDRLALKARVLRDGQEIEIPTREIVPGDIVLLSAGNMVPADGLLIAAQDCLVNQAALTGESLPVEKAPCVLPAAAAMGERTNALFAGSSLRSGTARMLVVQTGSRTAFGQITSRIGAADEETEFERGVRTFGMMLVRVMIVMVLAVLTVNQLMDRPFVESLLFAVALAVGLSPELLPAIISVTLAKGARHLAARGVIVRRLDAIENLGSMDILCTDKTGTLTSGKVRLEAAVDLEGVPSTQVLQAAFLNACFETGIANPLDEAIVEAAPAVHLSSEAWRKLDEIPYDFSRRRLSILVEEKGAPGQSRMVTKGAFAEMLAVSGRLRERGTDRPLLDEDRRRIEALFEEKGKAGFRVLAVAERQFSTGHDRVTHEDEADLTLIGLLLFLDPPKEGVERTIRDLRDLGITTKMISGDNRHVAAHVAAQVGLDATAVLTGDEIAGMSSEALCHRAGQVAVFAEIDPQQKEQIIHALQKAGHAVGYMGDGINDAPALRLADVGISVDQAVDVARESADIVLLQQDLNVLRQGIVDGRHTFANTLKYISITTSANFGNMVSMALATPLLPFLPLLPKQILLNNFLSDIPSIAISSDNVDPEHLEVPQRWSIRNVQAFMIVFGLVSSVFDLLTFGALLWIFRTDAATFQTVWFVISLLTELVVVLVLRTRRLSWKSRPGGLLLRTTLVMIAVGLILPFVPGLDGLFGFERPSARIMGFSIAIVACYALATEVTKRLFFPRREKQA